MSTTDSQPWPECITSLPLADMPIEGATGHLMQGENQQIVFWAFDRDTEVPEHSHEAQWGVALDGEMELTIDGKKHLVTRGDTYFVPRGVSRSAKMKKSYRDIAFFDQKDRYKMRKGCTD